MPHGASQKKYNAQACQINLMLFEWQQLKKSLASIEQLHRKERLYQFALPSQGLLSLDHLVWQYRQQKT